MKAVIFDLDDTLFPEIKYVKSGFGVVASYLSTTYQLDKSVLWERMLDILRNEGRGKIFNILLEEIGLFSDELLQLMIYLYRSHRPRFLPLFPESLSVIHALKRKGYFLGIITDGMASTQRTKISVLNFEHLIDIILCTDELGREYWKPSDVSFKIMLKLLGINSEKAVYVGDNTAKDFYAPNMLGMLTIQVKRSIMETEPIVVNSEAFYAKYIVMDLKGILPLIRENIA